jgi:hypothetical protein
VPGSRPVIEGHPFQAVVPRHVGGVDQAAQRLDDLAGPDGAGVGLGGVFQVPEQVGFMPTSA